jgi:hypothetical protein
MKFNKWTLGLAAVGVVSLASAARADEKINPLETALSNTTISGYVSTSFNWQIDPGGAKSVSSPAGYIPFQGQNKQDGFNLDVVKLSIAKPQDESPWASGYQVDLLFGPDAVGYNTSANAIGGQQNSFYSGADYAIKQAYVVLRTPVGNGIDWKIGVFDSIIGYEVFDAGSNPNYTRSWGYAIEPTELTGILGTYKVNDEWSVSAGIVNTSAAGINTRDNESGAANPNGTGSGVGSYWHKGYTGLVTYTAPSSWGWAAGSSLYAGIVYGYVGSFSNAGGAPFGINYKNGYQDGNQVNYYIGATFNTPWKQLTTGVAWDYAQNFAGGYDVPGLNESLDITTLGFYGTYKATDKLSLNGRGEWIYASAERNTPGTSNNYYGNGLELTGTLEYDMWANVISRLELRWDHITGGDRLAAATVENTSSVGLYANIIYKF